MKTSMTLPVALWALALACGPGTAAPEAARDSTLVLVVQVGSRLYPDWHEEVRVRLGETFFLGDSEFTARFQRFVPDFRIVENGVVVSASQQLANPAARVVVYHDTTATDSTWAFLKFPPHFSPRSFFTFKLEEILGYTPAPEPVAADSLATPGEGP